MARVVLCAILLLLPGCTGGTGDDPALERARERVEALGERLGRAEARIRSMEREARKPPPPPEPSRFVDLWGAGPTMTGRFLALPRLGTFGWRCDLQNRYFRIVYENAGATTTAAYDTPGPGQQRVLHTGGTLAATIHSGQTVHWTITHRHPPGFIRARVAITPLRTRHGNCLIRKVELEETSRLYD